MASSSHGLKQSLLGVLRQELFAAGSAGEQLWEHGMGSLTLAGRVWEAAWLRRESVDYTVLQAQPSTRQKLVN